MARFRFPRFTLKDLEKFGPLDTSPKSPNELALVMTGGGARGAYQVGLLRCLARRFPELEIPIITGVSAGAVNAVHLAAHHGSLTQAVDELTELWGELTADRVFRSDLPHLAWGVARWSARLLTGGLLPAPEVKGLLDTGPLAAYLSEAMAAIEGEITGIDYNLHRGTLKAVAVSATSYTTGQNVVFVQGRDIELWERANRKSVQTKLRVEHVLASSALPGIFPAVRIGDQYYGDGGIRLIAPLSPALHLGAQRILAVSTRYDRSRAEADRPEVVGYPPPAQIMGVLTNAVFLETLDQDVRRLERLNQLLERIPRKARDGMRPVKMVVIRPSRDLSKMARDFEPSLPRGIRYLARGLGVNRTGSPDTLAMMMFQPDYLRALIELGEHDAERRLDELTELLAEESMIDNR
ncbi:MAG: patatin [Gemmatimonadetes bacterium]|nr:patatin [Gemmatimonadota bacterium]NIQ57170.1 patatin [Gemmatimonadota bacterium]NIU77345.1 patatin [Gammaproteobacteria bacterium]NIX46603.1 patatin [Gemmatimonadota bacterium]NIY10927.1 patatin [Gemmatimonadota bacterium]